MKYRISDIINFVETSRCATISQSSKKLEISQPALSESLKRLESDLGYILFYRSRSGIQLTPSGRLFLNKAEVLMTSINGLEVDENSVDIFSGRSITIGCHSTVGQYCLPRALSQIKKMAPDFKIHLNHDLSRNIQTEIQKGNIDIGIVINPVEVPDLIIQRLTTDQVHVWTNFSNVEHDTVICNLNLFQTQSILKKWTRRPKNIIPTESLELVARLTEIGIGYGIIPERAVKLLDLGLKKMTSFPSYKDQICLLFRPEFGKLPSEKITIAALKQSLSEE